MFFYDQCFSQRDHKQNTQDTTKQGDQGNLQVTGHINFSFLCPQE